MCPTATDLMPKMLTNALGITVQIQTGSIYVMAAASVDTSNLRATQYPAPLVTVSRRTKLIQDHSDLTRYITGMIILITFFNLQALQHHRCMLSSKSMVHHCVWRLIQEHLFHYQQEHLPYHVVGECHPLQPSDAHLYTSSGELIQVLGTKSVHVCYKNQVKQLSLLVVPTDGPVLFG